MHATQLLLGSLVLSGGLAFAQSVPNSLYPGQSNVSSATVAKHSKKEKRGFFAPRKAKAASFKKGKVKYSARYEFYERVEKAAKEKQRLMRKLAKSQYSDPSYFGHKKKPKRRPPHKMRFCDECHIRH
jgi:hypothetical protein